MTYTDFLQDLDTEIEEAKKDFDDIPTHSTDISIKNGVNRCLKYYYQYIIKRDDIAKFDQLVDEIEDPLTPTQIRTLRQVNIPDVLSECNNNLNKAITYMQKVTIAHPEKISHRTFHQMKKVILMENNKVRKEFLNTIESQIQFKKHSIKSNISIFISLAALLAVLAFSGLDYFGDKTWQKEQIKVLQQQTETLQSIEKIISGDNTLELE